jgi:hypothetical protein
VNDKKQECNKETKLKERQTDMNRIFTKVLEKSCCHMVVVKQNSQIEKKPYDERDSVVYFS